MKQIKKGFTLIEILVVISIIGILASIAAAAYSSAQKQARDSRRKGDLQAIQKAFEQYYIDNSGSYPSSCAITATYLPGGFPVDPKTGLAYTQNCVAASYYFSAAVDSTTNGNNSQSNCSAAYSTSGAYYCVKNLQ